MSANENMNVNGVTEIEMALMRAYIHLRGGIQSRQGQAPTAGWSAPYDTVMQGAPDDVAEPAVTSTRLPDERPRS
jgi:hypothetical protein